MIELKDDEVKCIVCGDVIKKANAKDTDIEEPKCDTCYWDEEYVCGCFEDEDLDCYD